MKGGNTFFRSLAIWLVGCAGCLSPLQAPSAFSQERYLCDQEGRANFEALLATCRQATAPPCAGYVSVRGVIDDHAVTVDAPAIESSFNVTTAPGEAPVGDVFWAARSPYFRLSLHMGFDLDAATGALLDPVNASLDILNLEARGGNYLARVIGETRDVRIATPTEADLTFSGTISRGGWIEGCVHVFPQPLN